MSELPQTYAEYRAEVKAAAQYALDTLLERREDADEILEIVHEIVDAHPNVFVTALAWCTLWHSEHSDALLDSGVEEQEGRTLAEIMTLRAYFAFREDVLEELPGIDAIEEMCHNQEEDEEEETEK